MSTKDKLSVKESYSLKDYIDYGDRFLKVMESRGVPSAVVCEKAGVSFDKMSNLLNSNILPTRYILLRLCRVLQIEPEFFTLPEQSLLELVYKTGKHYCFNYYADFEIIFGYNPQDYVYLCEIFS